MPRTSTSSELQAAPLIRTAQPDDATAVAAIYAPYVAAHFTSFELEPPGAPEMAQRMERTLARFPWLVAQRDGLVVGYAYASTHRERLAYQWCVDVAVYLDRAAQGQGIGRQLYQELFGLLRRQGYVNAYAGIALPNEASVRLHEVMGFRLIGVYEQTGHKLGAWRDVGWWQLMLQPRPGQPSPPVPFAQLR